MGNLGDFNAADYAQEDFTPIPPGFYRATIVDSEMRTTQRGDGEFLELKYQILDDPYSKRFIFNKYNLKNRNPTTVKIANQSLADLCRAIGILRPNDSAALHGKPFGIRLELAERNDRPGTMQNVVKGHFSTAELGMLKQKTPASKPAEPAAAPTAELSAVAAPGQPATDPRASTAPASKPPWKR